jgi:putative transposase
MDNVFIERFWPSVKYEEIYLFEHSSVTALREGLEKCFERNNTWRPHEVLGNHTPSAVYADKAPEHHQEKVKPPRKVS